MKPDGIEIRITDNGVQVHYPEERGEKSAMPRRVGRGAARWVGDGAGGSGAMAMSEQTEPRQWTRGPQTRRLRAAGLVAVQDLGFDSPVRVEIRIPGQRSIRPDVPLHSHEAQRAWARQTMIEHLESELAALRAGEDGDE